MWRNAADVSNYLPLTSAPYGRTHLTLQNILHSVPAEIKSKHKKETEMGIFGTNRDFQPSCCHSWATRPPPFLCVYLHAGSCQAIKRKKDAGERNTRSDGKRGRIRQPALSSRRGKNQSLLTQVLDKGRFLRLGQSASLTPGKNMELRCKGSKIGWSYPTYLDTFNDSRLRCCRETPAV